MPAPGASLPWPVPAALAVSAVVTWLAIGYARRRRLIDEPGRRRSHALPTPRGGGIGIVVAVLACIGVPMLVASPQRWAIPLAFVLVALIGWIDDHRPLSARLRIGVHAAAALLVNAAALHEHGLHLAPGLALVALVVVFLLVAAINLHNFMDGIDGLLAVQGVYVAGAFAALAAWQGDSPLAWVALAVAAAVAGFLPFNFPRARVFMGDVGSGSLGFAIGLLGLAVAARGVAAAACVAIACSAFVVDAGATLVSRMLRGRRWYSAHREHLYQWLVRRGHAHARVVGLYLAWNLGVATPVIVWIVVAKADPVEAVVAAALVHLLAIGAWMTGKRRCLDAARNRSPD